MISPASLIKRLGLGGRLVPFFKCVCVYFLAVEVGGGGGPSLTAVITKGRYSRRIAAGLILSALGDALLVWPQHFVAGMAAFAAAHIAYLAAFRFDASSPGLGLVFYIATAYYMTFITPPEGLRILVPLYGLLLATMAWRGVERRGWAAFGAILFLISDAILGYSLFGGPVPYRQVYVMSTYYLGQLGIALSALETTRVKQT